MNERFDNKLPDDLKAHPDNHWLLKTEGWAFAGTLTFNQRQLDTQNRLVKQLFALYNYHLNEEFNWKNVPAYWRWEFSENERLHCHFALLEMTPQFHYLRGHNSFQGPNQLADWIRRNWKHGKSEFAKQRDEGWLSYITKKNSLMDSCFPPPIHYLKRQVLAGKLGCYFPSYYHPEFYTPSNNVTATSPVCQNIIVPPDAGSKEGQLV